ncbi:MBL fold metallo-hydrolase [Streptomyces arenae]|uniref:MBL fold metallo-hydrolase n=1 Tax=Streptomyces arenae TaxID=29301 RepID=UPI00265A0989|nr:MBL fold metallo-hydrolase [Streptomyces arenae]MCG7210097.1 MBL fold metallo-hydrolase [Streptomyces arenae]
MTTPDVSAVPAPLVQGEPVEVAEGVFVISDQRNPAVPNIGIVLGDRAALVIDTGMGPRNGAYVLDQAKRLAGDRHLYLTITHYHPEHGFGAQAFRGSATIVYNRTQHRELQRKGADDLVMFMNFAESIAAELADVEFVDPDIAYDGALNLDLGGRTAVLREWGAAHTHGDQTVLVDNSVLFSGDLAVTRMFPIVPYMMHGPHDTDADGNNWIDILDQLLALEPRIVIPGHGEVTDATVLHEDRAYLTYIRDRAAELKTTGVPFEEAVAQLGQEAGTRWKDWDRGEFIAATVLAFYSTPQPTT